MKARIWSLIAVFVLVTAVAGCSSSNRPDGRHQGNVILSIVDFDGLPISASINTLGSGGFLTVDELQISNIPADPTAATSTLMNVEIDSYEVGFTRADMGTRTPQPTVRNIFGMVPVGGSLEFDGLPIMSAEEFVNPPLSDLLFENGGFDTETGSEVILLNLELKFYGRTLAGTRVETQFPARFTIQFTQ